MTQRRLSFSAPRSPDFSLATIGTTLIICLVLSLGLIFLIGINPIMGLIGVAAIALTMLFFLRTELALPLYILVGTPTMVLSVSNAGIMSRLYIGNLLFAMIAGVWLLRNAVAKSKTRLTRSEISIVLPSIGLAVIGFMSIIASHLFPDPHVTYAFVHSDVPLVLVSTVEMFLLISLPLCIVIVPAVVCTLRDARRLVGAYLVVGLPYALGTIFAGPLHLYSQQALLGIQRPEVFGASSSGLGKTNLLFTCMALGHTLYARKESTRLGFGLLTCIYAAGVIMSFGRESWIGLLLAVWIILWFRYKNPLILLLPFVILLFLFLFFPGLFDFFDPSKVYGVDRLTMWQDAIAIWLRHPYLGIGAGNYQFFDLAYGLNVGGVAHNQFLEVLAEMGVQGLVCLLVMIIMIGRIVYKCFRTAKSDTGKAIALGYLGLFAALLFATFFTSSFLPSTASGGGTAAFIGSSYPWLFLGLVLSIPKWDHEATVLDLSTTHKDVECREQS
jgi:O-antigen ligase